MTGERTVMQVPLFYSFSSRADHLLRSIGASLICPAREHLHPYKARQGGHRLIPS